MKKRIFTIKSENSANRVRSVEMKNLLLKGQFIRWICTGMIAFAMMFCASSCGKYDPEQPEMDEPVKITTTDVSTDSAQAVTTSTAENDENYEKESTTTSITNTITATVTTTKSNNNDERGDSPTTIKASDEKFNAEEPDNSGSQINNTLPDTVSTEKTNNDKPVPVQTTSKMTTPPAPPPTTTVPPIQDPPANNDEKVDIIIDTGKNGRDYDKAYEIALLINELRREIGSPEMTYTTALNEAAMLRAEELSVLNSHDRPDGSPGLTAITEFTDESWYENENIAFCGAVASADFMYNLWYTSPGHYGTMICESYQRFGVGTFYKDGSTYAVLLVAGDDI